MSVYVPDEYGRRIMGEDRRSILARRVVRIDDLAGVAEVAEALSVTKRTVMAWAKRDDFPGPVRVLSCGPIYSLPIIRAWRVGNDAGGNDDGDQAR
jgi:hypothetical protein